jgi:hypothetical protein
MNNSETPSNSLPALLRELRDETTTLLRQEVALAKTEIRENVSHLGSHAIQIGLGAFVAYAGLIVLLIGLGQLLGVAFVRAGLAPDLAHWLAPSAVGLVVAFIGWGMLARAKHAIAHDDLVPHRTIESLQTNKHWAQQKLQPSHE